MNRTRLKKSGLYRFYVRGISIVKDAFLNMEN